jgi:alginate O-acetyltransferase complex protein AlgI
LLFSSPEFLFAFLPAFLALYFVLGPKFRNLVLFLASLFFYFTTSGELTVILALSVGVNYYLALGMERAISGLRRALLAAGVILNLAPLLYYKYSRFFLQSLSEGLSHFGLHPGLPRVDPILPIGISFFTFQAISYVADIYWGRVKAAGSLVDFGMYHSCFPQLIAGPIVRYEEIEPQVRRREHRAADLYHGFLQFCFGFGKKLILADTLGQVADRAFGAAPGQLEGAMAWGGLAAYTLQIYFDFSGYSDMAIGLGRALGFSYPENFDQPYRSASVTEFWRRWHMTLSRWFRDYVYIPLGGNRTGSARTLLNLGTVFFLCGLWHGAAYTFVAWGLYHGLLLAGERLGRTLAPWFKVPHLVGWFYAFVAVMAGWVLFRSPTLATAGAYFRALACAQGFHPQNQLFQSVFTADKWVYLAAGSLLALLPFRRWVDFDLGRYDFKPVWGLAGLAIFILGLAMMSVNGFSPFIYFRF